MSPVIETSVVGGPSSPAVGHVGGADASPSRVLDLRTPDQGVFVIDAGGRVKGLAARFLRTRCVRGTCVVFRQHSGRGRATNGRPDSSAQCERTKEGRPESRRLDLGVCTRRFAFDAPSKQQSRCALRSDRPKQPMINRLRCRRTGARETAPGPGLMKLFKLRSQG
jgi:hypothetical protein